MKVYRVEGPAEVKQAYPCATEGGHFWEEGLPLSREWFAENLGRYVEGWHAADEAGRVVGHLYWAPSERALVPYRLEEGAAFLYCEWVQRGFQGRGTMRLLFDAFVEELRAAGCKGILVDGTEIEGYMHRRHFEKRGFRPLGEGLPMYLPLNQETVWVELLTPRIPTERTVPVDVLIIGSRFCPVGATTVLYLRRAAEDFPGQVVLREVPAGREALEQYGVADGIFLNGRTCFFAPTPEAQVREAIRREIGSP